MDKLIHYDFEKAFLIVANQFQFATAAAAFQENRLSLLANCFFHCEKKIKIKPSIRLWTKTNGFICPETAEEKRLEEIDDDRLLLLRSMFDFQKS